MDWWLVGTYLILVFIGWLNIYAATHSAESATMFDFSGRAGKQFVWILTSISLAAIILYVIPPKLFEGLCLPFYIFVLVLLVVVIFVSKDVKGSHSWFELGPVKFQPAEISKITTSLMLAFVMSQQSFRMSRFRDFALVCAIIGLPMLIIVAESETGSALVYAGFIFVLYREGLNGWWLGLLGLIVMLFISTLTSGAYTSVMLMLGLLVLINSLSAYPKFWKRLAWGGGFIVLLLLLPRFMDWVYSLVQARIDHIANVIWVPEAGYTQDYFWSFLLDVKPLYVMLALCAVALPFVARIAYRKRDTLLALSIAAFIIGLAFVFSAEYIFQDVLEPHQRSRIEVLLGMKEDLSGVGYNVNQSKIAIGSGGLFGKGFLNGTQTTFGFVPEQATDFIFCTIGEEWGFLGCMVVILLYAFLIVRLIMDAERCRDKFIRIYGYCVAACIFMHLFINIGMTVGLMPVIGIPLPLLSYGGSSLWAFTILIFIFLSLYRDEKKYF